ncbi:hypothetical protein A3Q56_02624 [Intoshia linei]|uniref:AAA+ ATPase domain-containing protein n=1 Tax=Intoshia linei TaxID=1819745 RepID=A0A177B7F6_9BILA|nr:hypothetical protein A3Q56_02624 [Intoshia linei]
MPQWETTYTQNKTKSSLEPTTNSSRVMSLDVDDSKSVIGAKTIYRIISEHKDIVKIVIQLNSIIASAKSDILDVLKMFSQYSELWESEPKIKVIEFAKENPIISEFESKFRYYMNMEEEINEIISCYKVGPIVLHTDLLKSGLLTETKNWMLEYGKNLNARCSISMDETVEFFDNLFKCLSRPTKDLDDVRAHMLEVKEIRNKEISIDMTISPIEEAYTMLNKYEIIFDNAERVDSLSYGWSKLKTQATIVQNHLLEIQPKFKAELLQGVEKFVIDFSDFNVLYNESGPMVKNIAPREASDRLNIFQSKFDELWAKYQTYSGGEELFGLPVSDYPLLQKTKKELNLLQKLYQLYNNVIDAVNGYYDIAWVDIDIEKINTQLLDFQKKCRKLPKALKDWQASEDLRKTIDDFNETCPLLEMMSHKAMQKRHWDRITLLTNHTFDVESDTFLMKNLMEAPLLQNKDDIEDICISAVKERDIEAKLKQVINECGLNNIEFGNFKNRGELLLKGDSTSEIITLMEDSLMVLGSLLSNRYNVPFKPQIQEWVKNLTGTTEIIENWLIVQNLWIYLEAVFVGGDIAKQLPQEAKRFSNIDKTWIKIMQRAHENTNVIQCCVGDDTLSQLLPHLLEQLEICQKSLTGYLESKRLIFPRFFFVSDPALLEILGQASDSHTIQAHLLSVFDNTKSVKFDTNQYDKMLMIVSRENEEIQLDEFVMAQGGVELWLGELLAMTRKSVHSIIRSAYLQIFDAGFKLLEFEEEFPAQVGLLGLQFLWTRDAEIAIKNSRYDKKIMQQTNIHFNEILNSLIDLTTQELTKIARVKFETLITIHVHQKDIFEDLFKLHVRSIYDFEWLKQTRFYFKEDEDKCMISITDVNFSYQNEFLGCTDRLVITPLTDRCYITISQALGMSLGGAPAGPAGTGKTETVKDMGRCLGKYVVVFNCSDQMDYRGLGRIYKGLAQSGAWGCFDEFNRIDLPVLSVAAQQISIVLSSKKERKTQFIFTDGDVVELDPEFGLFLTMNPGYAGRQELPENLKVNFRTVAMMVPDRGIIIRVKLAACGFQQNVILAKKFFILYKLCEEQLSKQVHYDFGLRNILSVLRTLGANKRNNKNDSELVILMRDLRNMNLSKLVDEDEPLFISLIDDLFPGMTLEKMGYPNMEAAIDTQIKNLNLINHDPWVLKIIQLYETQNVRHGMMALGPSGSGKTNCISVLLKAMGDCGKPHREMRMNPKAITAPQMFGRLDVATNDWTDGIFSTMWRRTHKAKKGEHIWLILDGPVDAIWIENLNSVLDDNKTLTLANGDRISMAPNCKIVFEVHNIDNASPATVSRNGMVFMSSSIMNWDPILKGKSWLIGRPASQVAVIYSVFESIWEELYEFISTIVIPKMQILECMYIKQALSVLSGILPGGDEEKNILPNYLNRCIVFSLMWSLGALLELDDRKKMEDFIRSNPGMLELPPSNDGVSMFEYTVSNYIYPKDSIPEYTSILVPNVDNVRTEYLIGIIAKQGKGLLLIGEQGTAKTVMIHGYCKNYDPEMHMYKSFNFSSASTPFMFQKTIESYIDKRMGSTYGPPAGKKMTVFIDDINMPTINEWEDQITNEIVRQTMEMHGFYSLEKPGEFTNIVDMQFMAAMIHPGGGRNDIPQRLKRHFCIFNSTIPSDSSIDKIFNTIGKGYFCEERGFSAEICNSIENLVVATRVIWQKIKIKMLPTPAKFHYIFNLRDLSRIWQGMLTVSSIVATEMGVMYNLWLHECTRVIADRFIDFSDKTWMLKCVKQVASEVIGNDISQHLAEEPYFCDFMRDAPEVTDEIPKDKREEGDDADFEAPKIYEMVETFEILVQRLYSFQSLYNESIRGAKMDMVFFRDAMTNLLKISRIIRTSKGHALLVGVGGSGKQSLSRLASFIAGYDIFQITLSRTYGVNNLMDDLKVLYRSAGQKGKPMTFLFTDNEIKDESFLEYMNNLLSSGEVSNLFARDEMDEILQDLIVPMKKEFPRRPPSNENLYGYYMSRVRNNLHVVLCFSPDMVSQVCTSYFERFRRRTHVTPKSYLSFLEGYKTIYSLKYKEIGILAERMYTGLKKLMEATDSINELSKDLVIKEKELAIASKNADLVLADVTVSAQAAEKVKAQVQKVKNKAQSLVDEISTDKVIAEKKLEVARPALEQAEAALQTIKPAHISTVRKLAKPPFMIMKIMDCVSILFQKRMDTEDYTYNTAKNACGDVAGLLSWTKAMADFFMVNREVLPLKANLAIQEAKYNSAMVDLNEAQMKLDDKQKQLDEVQAKYDKAMSEKQTLIDDAESCRKKMSNATALIDGLSGEKIRWTESSKQFESQIHKLVGDVLIATGFLSYAGPFNQEYRSTMIDKWCREMTMKSIPFSDNLNVVDMLVDAPTIGEWNVEGLPNDELSIQNGLIVTSATRYPLLIDPQGQGKSWIKNRESNNELQLTNLNHKYFRTHLEECLSLGKPLLIEDVGEELDPVLDNILEKNFIKSGSNYKVKIGDKECDVMKNFRLYITTKRGNPSYSPEVSARTSIIDFTVTMKGLEDQLLSIVIFTEKKELESERTKLVNEVTLNKRKMKELEDNLLFRLTSTEGSLVEDESLIAVLRTTKITANEVNEKLSIAAETEIRINSAREEFRSVATRGSILYFFIVEIGMINNMYQTSLKQFLGIFNISIAISTKSPVNSKRIANIIETLTYESWRYLVRSLFEKDKFLSTVLITFKLEMKKGLVSSKEFSIFIKGGAALDLNSVEAKPKKWISDVVWLNLVELSSLPTFTQILSQVTNDDKSWKDWFDSDAPESTVLPDGYDNHLSLFHKLLLVRCWCPDRCIPMAKKYIGTTIGQKFVEGVALNLSELVDESNTSVPLICFLSMGSDPTESIERLAKLQNKSFEAISMGQGQEVHARRVINNAMSDGGWVLLQNCHLGLDYMEELMDVLTNVENAKPNFRCWLTTEEHPDFPINLLQMGIKYTAEPPGGMKAGLRRTYGTVSQDQLDIINVPQWKPLLYAVAFLHTVVQERRKFGPIGWNIPYEFNTSDLAASLQFVQNHLDDMDISKGVSWNTVRYMISEVQYGGRVTDDFDKRLLITYCKVWLGENIFNDSFNFYKGYVIPKCKSVDDYNNAIEKLPVSDHPEIFGLHSNADITYQTNTTSLMLQTIQSIQPKDAASGGGQTRESIVYQLASDVLEKLPEDYIFHMVKERLHKYGHLQPLNIFLRQEIDRMDRVIKSVRSTLNDLKLAIDGTIIMSENLMDALDNLFDARIPASWSKISWDGSTFGFWFTELVDRNAQFYSWIFVERPAAFWMTGFFNPQGFLTATKQEITRAHKGWSLDGVVLDNEVTKLLKEDINNPPSEGVYIYGLFIDGAGWDRRNMKLVEPPPKVLYTQLPVVHVFAINTSNKKGPPNYYECPVYKKPRRTDLKYIFNLLLKTSKESDHWVLRGVALL